ncbi:MAG: flagellar hook assembly protein FlgD, partial [Desulfobulbaceae bacterium]|nr:flagellar hook assembly protein FlgD [Desulfobulbaceae bacterium]
MDTAISGIPTVTNEMKTVGKKNLDRNDFMKLFITQLQYQDPMEP